MKEICFVNKGENVKKLVYSMGIAETSRISNDQILNYSYIELQKGNNDIICVRNYCPYYIQTLSNENTLLDIYARGYEVVYGSNAGIGDKVAIRRLWGIRYIVKPLEKLDDIAMKFGVDKINIIENNKLKTDKLFVGQVLII